jgi:orotidine-5'-phosphate decarboxylase
MTDRNPIFCAVDTTDVTKASALASGLGGSVGGLKIGLEFFTANGPEGYRVLAGQGLPIFLDLKFHDIPNTVARAVKSISALGPAITTIHTSGGPGMMKAAADAARQAEEETGKPRAKVVGVTVLTSMDGDDLASVGVDAPVKDQVRRLAALAKSSGLDGVVCAPHEIETVRAECGEDFMLVVPGIRPAGAAVGDQKRVMTPKEARSLGADVLVIGRPITEAPDPAAAARAISTSLWD